MFILDHMIRNARERFAVALANAAVDYVRRRVLCTERERELFDALLRGDRLINMCGVDAPIPPITSEPPF